MTHLGHALTQIFLRLPYDCSGGFRLYRLDRINRLFFDKINSSHYEFFFESLTVLQLNHFRISQVPIDLSKRVYGHSKMNLIHMIQGLFRLFRLSLILLIARRKLKLFSKMQTHYDAEGVRKEWDSYWSKKEKQVDRALYDIIAKFYRFNLIKPNLSRFIQKNFKPGASLLHAGCGSGEVDADVVRYANVTALDISPAAIDRYTRLHAGHCNSMIGNIFNIEVANESFDGIYNLGVMEHFQDNEVVDVLKEMARVIKPEGKLILFWPPSYGVSVIALHVIHFVLNKVLRRNIKLHPDEPSKVGSKRKLKQWLNKAGLELEDFSFSYRDAFTYTVVVARKQETAQNSFTLNNYLNAAVSK